MADAEALLDGFGQAENGIDFEANPLRRHVLVDELHRPERRQVAAKGQPVALVEASRVDEPGSGEPSAWPYNAHATVGLIEDIEVVSVDLERFIGCGA